MINGSDNVVISYYLCKVQEDLDSEHSMRRKVEQEKQDMVNQLEAKLKASENQNIKLGQENTVLIKEVEHCQDKVRALKVQEMLLKVQEKELDDLLAQVEMLEGSRNKLVVEIATIKKDLVSKGKEIKEARASTDKKVKFWNNRWQSTRKN